MKTENHAKGKWFKEISSHISQNKHTTNYMKYPTFCLSKGFHIYQNESFTCAKCNYFNSGNSGAVDQNMKCIFIIIQGQHIKDLDKCQLHLVKRMQKQDSGVIEAFSIEHHE